MLKRCEKCGTVWSAIYAKSETCPKHGAREEACKGKLVVLTQEMADAYVQRGHAAFSA